MQVTPIPNHTPVKKTRPEKNFYQQTSVIDCLNKREVVCARWYKSGAIVRCSVWISPYGQKPTLGIGSASGSGYNKTAAALEAAINHAGFSLDVEICGESIGEEALQLIAARFASNSLMVLRAHA